MEYIFEFILELLFESSIEVSKNNKFPKYIRYPLIAAISLFIFAVIGVIVFVGIISLKKCIVIGMLLILVGLFMLIMCVIKFRKAYLTKISKK